MKQIIILYCVLALFVILTESGTHSLRSMGLEVRRDAITNSMCKIYSKAEMKLYRRMITEMEYIDNIDKRISKSVNSMITGSNKAKKEILECAERASEKISSSTSTATINIRECSKTSWPRFLDDFNTAQKSGEELQKKIMNTDLTNIEQLSSEVDNFENLIKLVGEDIEIFEILAQSCFEGARFNFDKSINTTEIECKRCLRNYHNQFRQ